MRTLIPICIASFPVSATPAAEQPTLRQRGHWKNEGLRKQLMRETRKEEMSVEEQFCNGFIPTWIVLKKSPAQLSDREAFEQQEQPTA
jgi:hypothetical protein